MRLDGPTLAHAWLAVFNAAATEPKSVFHKSIALEIHLRGVQIVAADGRMMLTAYVPDLEHHYDGPPSIETAPERTIVLNDDDGRGRGLLGYVCQLGTRYRYGFEDYAPGTIEIRIEHDQKLPPGATDQQTFEGMEPVYSVLSVPDREKVHLQIMPVDYPDWRTILARQSASAGARRAVALDPETLERLARARKHAFGALQLTLGSKRKTLLRVEFLDSDPYVFGSIAPREEDDPDVYQDQDEEDRPDPIDPNQTTIADALVEAMHDLGGTLKAGESLTITGPDGKPHTLHNPPAETTKVDDLAAKRQTDAIAQNGRADLGDEQRTLAAAVELVVSTQFGSARMLSRKLGIPYAKAIDVMETLEAHGIVGPTKGTQARDVLITPDTIPEAIASLNLTEGTDQ